MKIHIPIAIIFITINKINNPTKPNIGRKSTKLDEVNKVASSKASCTINALDNDGTIKDKPYDIYPMNIKLIDYGIGEFSIDDVIFNIPTS